MENVNKQLLDALAQLDLAETEVTNAKAWSAGKQAKAHCDFALTAIATVRQAIAAAEQPPAVAVPGEWHAAMSFARSALAEAIQIAPLDKLPRMAGAAMQQIDALLADMEQSK